MRIDFPLNVPDVIDAAPTMPILVRHADAPGVTLFVRRLPPGVGRELLSAEAMLCDVVVSWEGVQNLDGSAIAYDPRLVLLVLLGLPEALRTAVADAGDLPPWVMAAVTLTRAQLEPRLQAERLACVGAPQ